MNLRIAFAGASGTGKTTLARFFSELLGLPMNPVGARSVSEAMGFASPYDVDAAGKRAEFQERLLAEKMAWESEHDSFVTDRTVADNVAYTALHDVRSVNEGTLDRMAEGLERYSAIFLCPVRIHCKPGDDPARVTGSDLTYHLLYESVLRGLFRESFFVELNVSDLVGRKAIVGRWTKSLSLARVIVPGADE